MSSHVNLIVSRVTSSSAQRLPQRHFVSHAYSCLDPSWESPITNTAVLVGRSRGKHFFQIVCPDLVSSAQYSPRKTENFFTGRDKSYSIGDVDHSDFKDRKSFPTSLTLKC